MSKTLTVQDVKKFYKHSFALKTPIQEIKKQVSNGKVLEVKDSAPNELGHTCSVYLNGEKIGTISEYE